MYLKIIWTEILLSTPQNVKRKLEVSDKYAVIIFTENIECFYGLPGITLKLRIVFLIYKIVGFYIIPFN